jgi:hypothetical protein
MHLNTAKINKLLVKISICIEIMPCMELVGVTTRPVSTDSTLDFEICLDTMGKNKDINVNKFYVQTMSFSV